MLERLTVDTFAPIVGERFALDAGATVPLSLDLVAAEPLGPPPSDDGSRTPFRLLLRGPRDPLLAQRIYALAHDALGTLEIFIVPVARDEAGTDYEAIFA
jgi:hypothetical protein